MDFLELEAVEGLRWSWNTWPVSKSEATALIIPLSIMCTPLMQATELPVLPYDPLVCTLCNAVLNPYACVDYQSRIWHCPFCFHRNPFPRSYSGIGGTNFPAEFFPTYSIVEYAPDKEIMSPKANNGSNINLNRTRGNGLSSSSKSLSFVVSSYSLVSSETNLPAELFPTYSIVEYALDKEIMSPKANNGSNINLNHTWGNGLSSSSNSLSSVVSSYSLVSSFSSSSLLAAAGGGGDSRGIGPALVFVVDITK